MNIGLKAGGTLGIVLGGGLSGFTWYSAHHDGQFSLYVALLAPLLFVWGLALVILPIQRLVIPQEIDGKLDYNLRHPKYTPLGWGVMLCGAAAGGLFSLYLKFGT